MGTRANSSGRTYGGETQAARRARRRRQFLDAGLEVFGTVGYRQGTVRQLCRHARLTDRYFYEEFGSAEDLLVAVYLDCIERIRATLVQRVLGVSGQPVDEVIRSTLDAFFESIEDPHLARVVWLEVLGVSPRVDQTYMDAVRSLADLLLQLGEAVFPELGTRRELHRMTAVSLIGAVSEAAKHWALSDYAEPRATMVEATAVLFQSMTRHLAEPSG